MIDFNNNAFKKQIQHKNEYQRNLQTVAPIVLDYTSNSYVEVEQTYQDQFFTLSVTHDPDVFYNLELIIDEDKSLKENYHDYPLMFMAGDKNFPQITYQGESTIKLEKYSVFDSNGFHQETSQQYLQLLPTSNFVNGDQIDWRILVHIQEGSKYVYKIGAAQKTSLQCPNSCSGEGDCISGLCSCYDNQIGADCNQRAFELQKDIQWTQTVTQSEISYAYYSIPSNASYRTSDMLVKITKFTEFPVVLYANLGKNYQNQSQIPNSSFSNFRVVISEEETTLKISNSDLISNGENHRLIMGFQSLKSESVLIELIVTPENETIIQDPTDSNMMIVYFLLGVAGILFLIWIVLTVIRIKYGNQQRQQQQQVQLGFVQRRRQRQNNTNLTPEVIEKFMPKQIFKEFKASAKKALEDEESCSVCLVEFEDSDTIRCTICDHLFHNECLEQWLLKHENCPLCREDLTYKKLQIFYNKEHAGENQNAVNINGEEENEDDQEDDDEDEEGEEEGEEQGEDGEINQQQNSQMRRRQQQRDQGLQIVENGSNNSLQIQQNSSVRRQQGNVTRANQNSLSRGGTVQQQQQNQQQQQRQRQAAGSSNQSDIQIVQNIEN